MSKSDPPSCPLCGSSSRRVFEKGEYWICDCDSCDHRFAEITDIERHVERVYGDHYFAGNGHGYHDYLSEGDLLVRHGTKYARLLNRYTQPGSILDVGAAAGYILKGYEVMGWQGTGIEPNPGMAKHARRRLGLRVETGTLETLPRDCSYDVISMIQVVAHLVDPRRALAAAAKLTNPGGFWLVETWNKESRTARVFGKSWHEYSPPSVLHWFSRESLLRVVEDLGFREVAHGRPTKWLRPSHANSIARNELGRTMIGAVIRTVVGWVPERLAIPYLADDVFWALFRKITPDTSQ
jgi:2-polyprenyl-3-methyl-5-hydroxy-6-metoxy-1,4-benzoquinol methylase